MKILYIALFCLVSYANAAEFSVFGIKTDFPMTDGQAPMRDIYVNIGTNQGVKIGSRLDAFRVLTTIDELQQKTGRNFSFKFAKLKIIHAEADMSVARVVEILPPESSPVGLFTNVMVGDQVQVSAK